VHRRRTRIAVLVTALVLVVGGVVAAVVALSGGDHHGATRATTPPATTPSTLWGDATPSGSVSDDALAVELGTVFTAMRDGQVVGLRFYKTPENTGAHVGHLWSSTGKLLATVDFTDESDRGWQTAILRAPVRLTAGQRYVASYFAPHGRYFQSEGFTGASSTPLLTVEKGHSGVFHYGSAGGFPTDEWNSSQYQADVLFAPGNGPVALPHQTHAPQHSAPAHAPRPSSTSSPLPTTPGATTLDLPRVPWWGGPAFYAKFAKPAAAGWTDPSFFPVAVFLGKAEQAQALKAIGINTYMGAEKGSAPMSAITRTGIDVIAQDGWTPALVGDDPRVVGWFLSDECDMGLGGCDGDQYAALAQQKKYAAAARGYDDGRLLQANFGNGVLGTYWSSQTMREQVGLVDVSSVDKYAYTSPGVDDLLTSSPSWPKGKNPATAQAYGWLQDRMASFSDPAGSKPNWVFVETARPLVTESGARTITGDQIEGAVWNGIIHGSAGIAYFQHNNDPSCDMFSLVSCGAALSDKVAQIDAQVAGLAPVINTQSYRWTFGPGLDTSLKAYGGYAYVFAMTDGSTGRKTFTLPPQVHGTDVEVVDEGRHLTASSGTFSDTFAAESTHHVYRVKIGG
jgi:hypothetical protein